ncbi:MAG: peptidylprolyl isomerase [Saprospiraceae bacterium]|jgi:peptidyl-prolyl cis-trans isomerase A (cyclophilin A)|nr:peptidylprolyl isomerase [Saprospiraceae bacterium]
MEMRKIKCLIVSVCILFTLVLPQAQKVMIYTSAGNIEVELYGDKAPVTTTNFLQYVKDGVYNGGSFYRAVRPNNQRKDQPHIEVIQGGIDADSLKRRAPIELERTSVTGLKHEHGTISMGRTGPNSASSEFFICINAQPSLDFGGNRNPDGQGFAAFGKVTKGMKVVRKIQQRKTTLYPALGLNQRLVNPVKIIKIEIIN